MTKGINISMNQSKLVLVADASARKRVRMAIVRFVSALLSIGRKSGASLLRLLCSIVMANQLPVDIQVKSALYLVI